MAPSKSFMIRQAILNVLADHLPETTRQLGAAGTLKANCWSWEGWSDELPSAFIQAIRHEYHLIASRYGAAA